MRRNARASRFSDCMMGRRLSARGPSTPTFSLLPPTEALSCRPLRLALAAILLSSLSAARAPAGALAAVYDPSERSGLARLAGQDVGVALVPLPFYAKHRAALRLRPRVEVVNEGDRKSVV